MPTLTTQSIGVLGAPLANNPRAIQLSRDSQAGVEAGMQSDAKRRYRPVQAANNSRGTETGTRRADRAKPRPEAGDEEEAQDTQSGTKDGDLPRIDKFV